MSVLHHESILEDCMEQAIQEFCEANKLTPDMFALIEDHLGVQIALDRKANEIFEGGAFNENSTEIKSRCNPR